VRALSPGAAVLSIAILALSASPALAANTGGVAAEGAAKAPAKHKAGKKKAATSVVPPNAAPVTSRSTSVAYSGPVYVKNAAGEAVPYAPAASVEQVGVMTGGSAVTATEEPAKPQLLVPGTRARYVEGLAAAPMSAPAAVQEIIWAGNQIIGLPYIYGGGHASFTSPGYDCSGTVSFALHGANLLKTPEDSSEFERYGSHGIGRWVTIFSNPGHAYMTVAGLRLDTSAADDPSNQQGPRWRPLRPRNEGYVVRHPLGL
jgi:cell wall-associated NlpC family hydrolase